MSTYLNTSMYQPGLNYSNYNNFGSYNTGLSFSNYINMNTSIFEGQNPNAGFNSQMNTSFYSPMASQAQVAPQQDNSQAFMQQLTLMLLSIALQRRNEPQTTVVEEKTVIDDGVTAGAKNDNGVKWKDSGKIAGNVATHLDPVGGRVLKALGVFKGW